MVIAGIFLIAILLNPHHIKDIPVTQKDVTTNLQYSRDDKSKNENSSQTIGWGLDTLKLQMQEDISLTGKGVKIAIIDTGISEHPDLVIAGGISTVDYTDSYTDDNGHGTEIAGIIGARDNNIGIVGVAPEASIYAVKAINKDSTFNIADIIKGIEWSIENDMDIIVISSGTNTDFPAYEFALENAYNQGIIIVASAGNNGHAKDGYSTVKYPAKYGSVVAVSAINIHKNFTKFSSTGEEIDFTAPGEKIVSTAYFGLYVFSKGTSFAGPHVAGVLALLKQAVPKASNEELVMALQKQALDLGEMGKDNQFGYGLVQFPDKDMIEALKESFNSQKR